MTRPSPRAAALAAATALLAPPAGRAAAAPFPADAIVVVRVGDGSVAFDANNLAQPVSLVAYDARTGAPLGSHPLPSAANDATRFVLSAKSDDHDGHLNLSADGQYLTLGGYRAAAGSAYPGTSAAASTPRVVARVGGDWSVDTTTALGGSYTGTTITAVASTNGQQFWAVGGNDAATGSGGLRYVNGTGPAATVVNVSRTQTGSAVDSFRNARLVDGRLYFNTASQGSFTNRGAYVATINGGLPAAATATASTVTPVITNREGSLTDDNGNADPDGKGKLHPKSDAVYVDLNADGTRETAYSTGGKDDLEKWVFAAGKWTRTDVAFVPRAQEINALDYRPEAGGGVGLFVATDAGIYKLTDTAGIGGGFASSQVLAPDASNARYLVDTYFVAAPGDGQFRGLAVVPEPGSIGLIAAAGAGLLSVRRRRRR